MIFKHIPQPFKICFRKTKYHGNNYYCNVCNSSLNNLVSGGKDLEIFKKLDIVGGGYHEYDTCPVCKASYRSRSVKLVMDKFLDLNKHTKVLHVAPEACFHYYLKKTCGENYICGDIEPERYSYYATPIHIDLTSIPFPDNTFDFVLCNHVLEHIPDDNKAMSEIYRVLRPKGQAILQVPISLSLDKTFEDSTIISPKERLKHYGQTDHVRLYALDYVNRLQESGFMVNSIDVNELSDSAHFDKLKLDLKEKVFLCLK